MNDSSAFSKFSPDTLTKAGKNNRSIQSSSLNILTYPTHFHCTAQCRAAKETPLIPSFASSSRKKSNKNPINQATGRANGLPGRLSSSPKNMKLRAVNTRTSLAPRMSPRLGSRLLRTRTEIGGRP